MLNIIKNSFLIGIYTTRFWKMFRLWNKGRLAILMYHGVTDQSLPVWAQVQKDEFELQMQYVSENCKPISFEQAVKYIRGKIKFPDNSVVITFDDGFKNNFTSAYPILKKYNIPATIFITTSMVDKDNQYEGMIWPDYVQSLFLETNKTKIEISQLKTGILPLNTVQDKIAAKNNICSLLKRIPSDQKYKLINWLKEQLDVASFSQKSNLFLGLSWDEIEQMDREGLISFGAHTINHEILSQIPTDRIHHEIMGSKEIIEKHLDKKITLFAYPNGQPEDFNEEAKRIVVKNFQAVPSSIEGLSGHDDDLYLLRRLPIGNDTTLWQFKLHLAGIYALMHRLSGA